MDFYDLINQELVYFFPEICNWRLQSICAPHIYSFIHYQENLLQFKEIKALQS